MGRYDRVAERTGYGAPGEHVRHGSEAVAALIALSHDPDPLTRRVAAKNLCPCHVRANVPDVWERLFALALDPDPGVRADAVHALADGSPRRLEQRVLEVLAQLRADPDRRVRRRVNRVLRQYGHSGRVNAL